MPDTLLPNPTELALANLHARVQSDASIPASLKDALLKDLSAETPANLKELKKAILEALG